MKITLPSRYEDLSEAYRGRLSPNNVLISIIDKASKSMKINGGIRFLPIYGESGSGKSSASRELSTHMPNVVCSVLDRDEIESKEALSDKVRLIYERNLDKLIVCVVDQYEENVQGRDKIPTQFVENLSVLDRGDLRKVPVLFIWLTTSLKFRDMLVDATSRNKRLLLDKCFEIKGPVKADWPIIIEETFSFHNADKPLSDYGIIRNDIVSLSFDAGTIGECIKYVGDELGENIDTLQNISEYQVILLWPVCDDLRNQRVLQFAKHREGYRLNWDSWSSELSDLDKRTLPLSELNRTRLYFDFRVIPIRAADLHRLCLDLDNDEKSLGKTYLTRFSKTHFYHVISDNWEQYDYNPARERKSQRSNEAKSWYETVTTQPTQLGKRIAKILVECGLHAEYEKEVTTEHSNVRADVFILTKSDSKPKKIVELKAYSSENTMPSTIKEQIKVTLRRHAQLAGFLSR